MWKELQAIGGKNQKNMASYKFWQTQPVPSFRELSLIVWKEKKKKKKEKLYMSFS